MSGVQHGMSWGIAAFMGNLEQAAANMFHQEEMHELSFSSTESKRFPTFELEARLPAKRG